MAAKAKGAQNTLFVRNLSSQVSERVVREIFSSCDTIERVLFRAYPNRAHEFYAQVDFASPKGVLEGHTLSGTPILGVTCQVTVIDPGAGDLMLKVVQQEGIKAGQKEGELPPTGAEMAEPVGVQLQHMQAYRQKVEDKRLRTVHIAGLWQGVESDALRMLCTRHFGEVEALRIDEDAEGTRFGLVEFKERGPAHVCKVRAQFMVDGRLLVFSEAKTMVDTRSFAEESVQFTTPVFDSMDLASVQAKKQVLDKKLAQARMAAAELFNEPLPAGFKGPDELDAAPASEETPRREEEENYRETALALVDPKRRRADAESRSRERRREKKKRKKEKKASLKTLKQDTSIHLADDEELAMVPNTEHIACSSSCSGSLSPLRMELDPESPAEEPAAPKATAAKKVLRDIDAEIAGLPAASPSPSPTGNQSSKAVATLSLAADVDLLIPSAADVSSPSPARSVSDRQSPARSVSDRASPVRELSDDEVQDLDAPPPAPRVAVQIAQGCQPAGAAAAVPADAKQPAKKPSSSSAATSSVGKPVATSEAAVVPAAPSASLSPALATNVAGQKAAPKVAAAKAAAPKAGATKAAGKAAATKASTTAPKAKPWECKCCGEPNKVTRKHCNNCGARPDGTHPKDDVRVGSSSSSSSDDDDPPKRLRGNFELSEASSPSRVRSVSASPVRDGGEIGDDADPATNKVETIEEDEEDVAAVKARKLWEGEAADARARILHGAYNGGYTWT
eukprot:TRINITY_DN84536_c0_g1_i1.p1 TRINITY_DN84536_c0_g1~~TRINITY_DN84536_c0_g1_i1.p1  ORF type:complete len:736 (+),score=230.26 TRINITY_DN84536_c0_g1_i1:109-2316(+)